MEGTTSRLFFEQEAAPLVLQISLCTCKGLKIQVNKNMSGLRNLALLVFFRHYISLTVNIENIF
jgi:hypothetical protein